MLFVVQCSESAKYIMLNYFIGTENFSVGYICCTTLASKNFIYLVEHTVLWCSLN